MKKLFITLITVIGMFFSTQAQDGLNIGGYLGVPVADGSNYAKFSIGLDANYLIEIADRISVGPAVSLGHSFGKDRGYYIGEGELVTTTNDPFQFVAIAGAGRFSLNDKMTFGADLGFALGINDGNDGGFYFRPMFGYNIKEKIQLNASLIGISIGGGRVNRYDYGTFGVFAVGATFNL